jgi:heptosyltransferase-2
MQPRFNQIAIIKPDHVGDLVLAIPNINALAATAVSASLFVCPSVLEVARRLFSQLQVFPIEFNHISKTDSDNCNIDFSVFAVFDVVFLLRRDQVLDRHWCRSHFARSFCVGNADQNCADTFAQAHHIQKIIGPYDVHEYLFRVPPSYPKSIKRIGLSVGSGFATNTWPWLNWVELYRKLVDREMDVTLIGGPAEVQFLPKLAALMGLPREKILIGSYRIEEFLEFVQSLDVVIASDGGTGHLCSLSTSIISLQMSGSWRRFSPFGAAHRTLTRDLPCAPCLNFDKHLINLCASRECSYLLMPDHVIEALHQPSRMPGTVITLDAEPPVRLIFAASHMGQFDVQIKWL